MHITTKSRYAVRALVELSLREGEGPVPLAELARGGGVPFQFLEQIFAHLKRAGIVNSKRGVKGGYMFAVPSSQVSVLAVVEALDGEITPAQCAGGECAREEACAVSVVWLETKRVIEELLRHISIAELAHQEMQQAVGDNDDDSSEAACSNRSRNARCS